MKVPFVISVSGIPCGGKTTVVNALKERLKNCIVVKFDDYDDVYLDRDINEWSADGEDADEWHVEPIADDLEKLMKEHPDYILLEFPFGRGNRLVGQYIDFAVFIDTPLDIALARRIIRDYTDRAPERHKIEVNLSVIGTEMRHYLTCSRPTYARMPETQKPISDVVVDGTKTPEAISDEIMNAIYNR